MSRKALIAATLLGCSLMTGGCATLPHAGPSTKAMRDDHAVDIIRVTPQFAEQSAQASEAAKKQIIASDFAALNDDAPLPALRFAEGDKLRIALWSYAGFGPPSAAAGGGGGLTSSDLGQYTVSQSGDVQLPFVGTIRLAGLTIAEAQDTLSRRFAALHTLARPSAVLSLEEAPHAGILVSGAIGAPKLVPWSPGGVSLARALTAAMAGQTNISASGSSTLTPTPTAEVLRADRPPVNLPLAMALESQVMLRPGDRVVVKNQPLLRVMLLGGGISKPNLYGFGDATTLAQAIAQASGLNDSTADTHGVYILRQKPGARPELFDFAWNHIDGLISAQRFPLRDGDIVYVGNAPFTDLNKVLSAVYSVAVPIQIAR